ncbi:T9SS type A sorting domain-containing protein [Muribaculum intestinale]|jgi:hypothetical protein|uniref:T9SS type A sorting domain-containing protein n=1 Tax=Muribaculum intestinale TaxID=1796646 RepID=UPI0025B264FD|nr:T9SS type A sorting domain-containing protein [Muribaculum intestinale]
MEVYPIITRLAILLGFTVYGFTASAAGDNMLVHINGSSTPLKVEISEKTKITFDNSTMCIAQTAGETAIDVNEIDRIVFDLHTSSIDDTSVSLSDDVTFTVAGTLITAKSVSESHLSLHIYDTSGRKVAEVSGHGSTDYDFSGAKSGVYIILCGYKTIKYLNR